MRSRDPNRRQRITVPGRKVTRKVSPAEVEDYLLAKGWRPSPHVAHWLHSGEEPDHDVLHAPRIWAKNYLHYSLKEAIKDIARHERRSPGEVLEDIECRARWVAAGEG